MGMIDMQSVMSKVDAWAKTEKGKQTMKNVIAEKRKAGVSKTAGGSELLTNAKMAELAEELIAILRQTAASYDLAPSVMAHFDSLTYVVQDLGNGKYECDIYFADDLSRESLDTDENPGDGINNIIALFNNGYVASAPKYGWWNGYKPTGESLYRSGTGAGDAYVRSTQARPSLHFMQRAIEDFNLKYKTKYPLTVWLNDAVYDGNYAGSLNGIITKL